VVVIVMVVVVKKNRRDANEKGVVEMVVVTLKMAEMSRSSRRNGYRSGGWRCYRRRGARPLAKHGGQPRRRWWGGGFVEGFSGGGGFGER